MNYEILILLELKKAKEKLCGGCGYQGKVRYKKICRIFNKEIKYDKKNFEYIRCKKCKKSELK